MPPERTGQRILYFENFILISEILERRDVGLYGGLTKRGLLPYNKCMMNGKAVFYVCITGTGCPDDPRSI